MRKKFIVSALRFATVLLFFTNTMLQASACTNPCGGPAVTWDGSANITADVTDQNINIDASTFGGIITLQGGITVTAATCDITVSLNASAIIQADPVNGDSRLYLYAAAGQCISVNLGTNDLTFQGAAAGATGELDLLVVAQGPGIVIFNINDGQTLSLVRNGANGGAVQMYRQSDPAFAFATMNIVGNQLSSTIATMIVGSGSILSYLIDPTDGSTSARINFFSNDGTLQPEVRLIIQDQAAVLVRSNVLTPSGPKYVIADINPAAIVDNASSFIFAIASGNTANPSGLLVENYNATLGEFMWDPWCVQGARDAGDAYPYGSFNGVQYGFIVGSSGQLYISPSCYLDYIALSLPICPAPAIPNIPSNLVASYVKARNPSALFTDSIVDQTFSAPSINIGSSAALYLRSGVGNDGSISNDFTVDPANRTPGAGVPVMDIEGELFVVGANTVNTDLCFTDNQVSKIEVLSWQVDPTVLGPLFVDNPVVSVTNPFLFPTRTFTQVTLPVPCSTDEATTSYYVAYNKGYILNNGRADLIAVSLDHTDEIHVVLEDNDVTSEPTYVGGDTWIIPCAQCIQKPLFAFFNSRFNLHTSAAVTGVDLLTEVGGPSGNTDIPGGVFNFCANNISKFVFYQNGQVVDNGTGRSLILGTFVGSTACDGCTVISKDAQLNVMQDNVCEEALGAIDELVLTTSTNSSYLQPNIPDSGIENQYSIQTIYLGNSSNISVGAANGVGITEDVRFASYPNTQTQFSLNPLIFPTLFINSNLFSFETRGGSNNQPETSNVTGQGGIFVDTNGVFIIGGSRFNGDVCVECLFRANMGTMVTVSGNGFVDLPVNRVLFDPRVGIAFWKLDMNNPDEQIIVSRGQEISDYTLNWLFLTKDYELFSPYYLTDCYSPCFCPAVTTANVSAIPTIEGTVQQLQIKGSRLGDPAHVKISGGIVEELIMLSGYNSSEAPVAVVVLEDQGQVGLGSAHRTVDSLEASIQLGVNGVNIILNGNEGQVNLNEDIIVNNICAFLPGPDITESAVLRISSDCCRTLRVTKNGVLDLSGFTATQTVEFAGNVRVVFEPGAKVIFANGAALTFAENSVCEFEPIVYTNIFEGNTLSNTDGVRVRFVGNGELIFTDCASAILPRNAFVGVENDLGCAITTTVFGIVLNDSATFKIGDPACRIPGGALQVGNVIDLEGRGSVSFTLTVDGPQASFEIGEQGFFGLGVGIVEKGATGHDAWRVAPTYNLNGVFLDLNNGRFVHAQLYAGSDDRSALIALSNSVNDRAGGQPFTYVVSPLFDTIDGTLLSNMSMLGGGNLVACPADITQGGQRWFNPIVGLTNGTINLGQTNEYEAGIWTSTPLLGTFNFGPASASATYSLIRLQDIDFVGDVDMDVASPAFGRGVVAPSDLHNQVRVGYIDSNGALTGGSIGRAEVDKILGKSAQTSVQEHSLEIGVAQITLVPGVNTPRLVEGVSEIGQ